MISFPKTFLITWYKRLAGWRQEWRNVFAVDQNTRPGKVFFQEELSWFLEVDGAWIDATAAEYRACPAAWRRLSGYRSASRRSDGHAKSLDVAEGFALWALVKRFRPKIVVELGVQFGISSRLWKEALNHYVPGHTLILCDLEDQRRFIGDDEATFLHGDAMQTLPPLFQSEQVDVLHNDAHPYDLIRWSVAEALRRQVPILTFHDVGRGRRGPFKVASHRLTAEQKSLHDGDFTAYGHWERHVMAEIFTPAILEQDRAETKTHRLQIFDSLFGLGVVIPRQ